MEHTKEPWYVGQGIDADLILDADGNLICANCVSAEVARRIVACVNACAGVAAEDFKSGAVMVCGSNQVAYFDKVLQQRDELLAASQMALRLFDHEGRECREAIVLRRAIDNSTGETK